MLVPVKEVIQSDRGKRLLKDEYSTPLVISERTLQGQLEHKGPNLMNTLIDNCILIINILEDYGSMEDRA